MDQSRELVYLKTMSGVTMELATFFASTLVEIQARLLSIEATQRATALATTATRITAEEFDRAHAGQLEACRKLAQARSLDLLQTQDLSEEVMTELKSSLIQ